MKKIAIVGGGAAGFFCAIRLKELLPDAEVVIFEQGRSVLDKVRISGGGRCNVTHDCPEASALCAHYPRGARELLGTFHKFGPADTVAWFAARGVTLKTEPDGRMFPVSNSSESVIRCFLDACSRLSVRIFIQHKVVAWTRNDDFFQLQFAHQPGYSADALVLAGGSSAGLWRQLAEQGHRIVAPVPSLFTFNVPNSSMRGLEGIAVPNATVWLPQLKISQSGALLITHWGFSGPAVLKLSAWAARLLHVAEYRHSFLINWLGDVDGASVVENLKQLKIILAKKQVTTNSQFGLSARLWERFCLLSGVGENLRWADMSLNLCQALANNLTAQQFQMNGKTTYKEEFVTSGGIALDEVNFKTMESKKCSKLFFAGELLDIDAITGGFNFQAAWTTSTIAAEGVVRALAQ